jgi:hypothetical protein
MIYYFFVGWGTPPFPPPKDDVGASIRYSNVFRGIPLDVNGTMNNMSLNQ